MLDKTAGHTPLAPSSPGGASPRLGRLGNSGSRLRVLVALATLLALVAVACGTRVSDEQLRALAAGGSEGALTDPGVAVGGDTVAPETEKKGGAGGDGGSAQGTGTGGGGSSCDSNPGATDVGVSRTRIEVGASYAESSLVPGQFRPAMDAIQAYANMFNRAGGHCGRGLDFHFHNDGLNAQRYGENVRHLVEEDKVFATLGSLSAADSGACSYLRGERPPKGVPDIGTFALSYCRGQASNFYSPMGSLKKGIYGCCVDWQYLRKRFRFKNPAVHYLDIEISRDQGLAVVDALVRTVGLRGRGDVYQGEHSPAQFSYAGDVQDMRDEGVDSVWSSMDLNNNVKLVRAMCQQDWRPKAVHVEISAYDPQFIQRVGRDCIRQQNIWMRSFHLAFTNPNEEVRRYMSTLRAYCPECQPTTFGLEGWLSAKLFVEVLEAVGPDLTRERFYRALNAVRNWTADGVMGPNTPARRLIYHCNVMIHVRPNGFFQERGFGCGEFYRSGDYRGPPVGP